MVSNPGPPGCQFDVLSTKLLVLVILATNFRTEREQLKATQKKTQARKSHSKKVPEQKCKNSHANILLKKDTHVYNNCFKFRSRAIKQDKITLTRQKSVQHNLAYQILKE